MRIGIRSVISSPRVGRETFVKSASLDHVRISRWTRGARFPVRYTHGRGSARGTSSAANSGVPVKRGIVVPVTVVFANSTAVADRPPWRHVFDGTIYRVIEYISVVYRCVVNSRCPGHISRAATSACVSCSILISFDRQSTRSGDDIIME